MIECNPLATILPETSNYIRLQLFKSVRSLYTSNISGNDLRANYEGKTLKSLIKCTIHRLLEFSFIAGLVELYYQLGKSFKQQLLKRDILITLNSGTKAVHIKKCKRCNSSNCNTTRGAPSYQYQVFM